MTAVTPSSFVLLGVPDEVVTGNDKVATDFTTSKCGGRCNPPPSFGIEEFEKVIYCELCGGGLAGGGDGESDGFSSMKLVCQIYCPLAASRYHRTLYILACVNRGCWNREGAWMALRGQSMCDELKVEAEEGGKKKEGEDSNLFDLDEDWDDDDGVEGGDCVGNAGSRVVVQNHIDANQTYVGVAVEEDSSDDEDRASHSTEKCNEDDADDIDDETALDCVVVEEEGRSSRLDRDEMSVSPSSSILASSALFPFFDPFYIACVEEESEASSPSSSSLDFRVEKLLKEYRKAEGNPEDDESLLETFQTRCEIDPRSKSASGRKNAAFSVSKDASEKYEKGVPKHGDLIFQRFVEVIAKFPSQLLRYSWSGSPLLMSSLTATSSDGQPRDGQPRDFICLNCGAKKVFELQLLPTMVHFLKSLRRGGEGEVGPGIGDIGSTNSDAAQLIDFGTVLVFSCANSCWNEALPLLMRETVVLQKEPGREFSTKK